MDGDRGDGLPPAEQSVPRMPRVEEPQEAWAVALASAALTAVAFSLALASPELGLVAMVSGLPLALCRLRVGRLPAGAAAGLAMVAVGLYFSAGQALLLGMIAAMALTLAEGLVAGRGILAATFRAGALVSVPIAVSLLTVSPEYLRRQLTQPLDHYRSDAFAEEMRERGVPDEEVADTQQSFAQISSALAMVYPAAYLLFAWLMVLLNGSLLRLWLARRGPGWLQGPGFESLRLSLGVVVAFVVSGLMVVFPPLRETAYNLLLVIGFLFGLQGLSVAIYYANRLSGPRPLRALVVVLMLLIPLGAQLLALVGLFDNFFNFRRWADPPDEGPSAAEGDDGARG